MKKIELTQGYETVVDDTDYEWLSKHIWCADVRDRAIYAVNFDLGRMHVAIMKPPLGLDVSHKDRNGLNNCRYNLEIETRSNNIRRALKVNLTTGFRGVAKANQKTGFSSSIRLAGRRVYLGTFDTAEDAARAYDEAVRKFLGPSYPTNFPEGVEHGPSLSELA